MSETTAGSDVVAMKIKADKKGYNCFFVCVLLFVCVISSTYACSRIFMESLNASCNKTS